MQQSRKKKFTDYFNKLQNKIQQFKIPLNTKSQHIKKECKKKLAHTLKNKTICYSAIEKPKELNKTRYF